MLDPKTILEIQAHVDGQLTGSINRRVADRLERDPEGQALRQRLENIRRLVKANEPRATVPVPRAVYWAEIARRIQPATPARRFFRAPWLEGWWRALAPAGALAALGLLLWFGIGRGWREAPVHLSLAHEVETPLRETTSFTYRSEAELMTVVWVETGADRTLELIH